MAKRVLVATAFNLLFEYSLRGVNDLAHRPLLPVFLCLLYWPYFMLLDEFVRVRRAGPMAVAAVGFGFGALSALFLPGTMFGAEGMLGIRWGVFLFVNTVWWATLQGVWTMYVAVRIVPRTGSERMMSRRGRAWVLAWLVAMLALFRAGLRNAVPVRAAAAVVVFLVGAAALAGAWWLTRRARPQRYGTRAATGPWWFFDALMAATALVFAFCALFLIHDPMQITIHHVNRLALRVVSVWTLLLFAATLTSCWASGRRICV